MVDFDHIFGGVLLRECVEVWPGTLALMVLSTLKSMGRQHGYGIARTIEAASGDVLTLNYGTLYPLLMKLVHQGVISYQWGRSANGRRAKFYRLTRLGHRQFVQEMHKWRLAQELVGRFYCLSSMAGDPK